jgi:tRNA(His) 5'-end guanylyltransferase
MKGYENISRLYLTRRMPYIIRIDGRSFHTFTRNFEKPWDLIFTYVMLDTAKYLCENIEGVKIAYWQSDEVSFLLTDYDNIDTQAWFDKNIQKIVSISAGMASMFFNKKFEDTVWLNTEFPISNDMMEVYKKACWKAIFDSRVFTIPKEEVCNYFIWRQQDATRNSVQGLAQSNFPHKQLYGLNTSKLQDKLLLEKNINWNDCLIWQKRGACIIKENYTIINGVERSRWIIDREIPIFTQDRNYIERFI